jgi:upstream activation factor subunit UAF30
MPKKTVSKTETEIVTPAPVVVDAAAPVAAAEKKSRKPKAVKTEAVETSAPVVAETAAPATDATVAADAEAPLAEQSVEFLAKLQQLGTLINSIKSEYKALEKKWSREVKTAQKQSSKRKRKAGNRAPSGFVKPTKISDELASFLGKEKGAEMARTDVTREINTYIRAHKLQDSTNGRKINPDKKLAALLKLKTTDELTYFNLQKYMSPHFAKAVKEGVVA